MYPTQRQTDTQRAAHETIAAECSDLTMPATNAAWAGVALVFFWPLGIAALHQSSQVTPLWLTGDHEAAEEASEKARAYGSYALGLFVWTALVVATILWP
ncbi:CD225/dispanin family protein [Gordonia sp. LSe1-13]|uniref:CD225/dispanin family protein n=2 Tax=Gordonia TaxID=2053 RepID=A0ABU7MDA7_9ACTN|nr:CD225/dispanin family protein [Gordonia sp. LSe1-13]MEE4022779.1 CD225/dispanin family protein [Gordonia sp. PKS22-38]